MLFHLLLFWFWQLSLTVWFSCVTFVSCVTGNSFGKLTPFVTELPISDARLYFHSTLCQPFKSVSCSHRLPAPRSKWRRSHLHVFSFCRETVKLWIEKGASWFAAHQLFLGLQLLISFQQKKKKKVKRLTVLCWIYKTNKHKNSSCFAWEHFCEATLSVTHELLLQSSCTLVPGAAFTQPLWRWLVHAGNWNLMFRINLVFSHNT